MSKDRTPSTPPPAPPLRGEGRQGGGPSSPFTKGGLRGVKEPLDSTRSQVLIVDDVPANIKLLRDILKPQGYQILVANHGEAGLRIAAEATPDLILLDIVMPEMDGYEVCRQLKQNDDTAQIPVIFITAIKDKKEDIIKGFHVGGVDYITKPIEKEEVLLRVKTHLELNRLTKTVQKKNRDLEQRTAELARANQQLQQEIAQHKQTEQARKQAEEAREQAFDTLRMVSQREAERWGIPGFVGRSQTIREIVDSVRRLADVKTSVLILGENGTGKELIARALHFGGTRSERAFVPVNCSAIPGELAESILFGHVKGAFTGANTDRKGYFELADGGTLFLDEIEDTPLELQAKLLRTLEDGRIIPIGGTQEKHVDVRILAATNADLKAKMAAGVFREDLYYRIAGFVVTVPPLRARPEDIPLLADHFLSMLAQEMGLQKPEMSDEALSALKAYHFPGNIRELKNIIESALITSGSGAIRPEHLPFIGSAARLDALPRTRDELRAAKARARREAAERVERAFLTEWLSRTSGNVTEISNATGVNRAWLEQLISKHQLDRSQFRKSVS